MGRLKVDVPEPVDEEELPLLVVLASLEPAVVAEEPDAPVALAGKK